MLSTPCSGEGKNAVFDFLSTTYIQGEGEGLTPYDTTALLMGMLCFHMYSCSMCPVLQGMLGSMHVCLSLSVSVRACMKCTCMYFLSYYSLARLPMSYGCVYTYN